MNNPWNALARTVIATIPRTRYAAHAAHLQHFLDALPQYTTDELGFMPTAIEQLYATGGTIRIGDLAAQSNVSMRQFERRFKQAMGISPKLLARLIRFELVRDRLIHGQLYRQIDLAGDFGYTDQSHLIHEFKALAAFTPSVFVARAVERSMSRFYYAPDPRQPYHGCTISKEHLSS